MYFGEIVENNGRINDAEWNITERSTTHTENTYLVGDTNIHDATDTTDMSERIKNQPHYNLLDTNFDDNTLTSASSDRFENENEKFRATASNILEEIKILANSERQCPEIMPYPTDVINNLTKIIKEQEKRIVRETEMEKLNVGNNRTSTICLSLLPSSIMKLEIERVKFFLCELIRCRLHKIEQLCTSIYVERLAEPDNSNSTTSTFSKVEIPQRCNLSAQEQLVADRLAITIQRAVIRLGMHNLPTDLQYLTPHLPYAEGNEILPSIKLRKYVFAYALQELGKVLLTETIEEEIHAGEMFILPYHSLREQLIKGQVRLL